MEVSRERHTDAGATLPTLEISVVGQVTGWCG